MRTVDVYDDNYVTNATNVKDALETYGTAWFSSVVLDTESDADHAHVKCYVQSQVDPVLDMTFSSNGSLGYRIGEYSIVGDLNHFRMDDIVFTDNGIVLIRRSNSGAYPNCNDTFIIGKNVDGDLCGCYIASSTNSNVIKMDYDIDDNSFVPAFIKLTTPTNRMATTEDATSNNAANPYVIAYPFVSRYSVSNKIWRIRNSFYYKAKTVPFTIFMNNKTYLTVANGSMIIETT